MVYFIQKKGHIELNEVLALYAKDLKKLMKMATKINIQKKVRNTKQELTNNTGSFATLLNTTILTAIILSTNVNTLSNNSNTQVASLEETAAAVSQIAVG